MKLKVFVGTLNPIVKKLTIYDRQKYNFYSIRTIFIPLGLYVDIRCVIINSVSYDGIEFATGFSVHRRLD
jgi:hypothetical protein